LASLSGLAKEQGWVGSLLFGLFEVRKELTFKEDCLGLGISSLPTQVILKGKLAVLFGESY
jgi:hypothetical protein